MKRGTTPTHIFGIPFEAELIDKIRVSYAQGSAIVLEKTEADCTIESGVIRCKLTQEETLGFDHNAAVDIQVKVLTVSGDVLASDPVRVSVGKILNEEVLVR